MKLTNIEKTPGVFKGSVYLGITFCVLVGLGKPQNAWAFGSKKPVITKPVTPPVVTPPPVVVDPPPVVTPPGGLVTNPESLNAPWAKSDTAIVIDAYQGNAINWDKMATDRRVAGVIHRSSIGQRVDTEYVKRKKVALERG